MLLTLIGNIADERQQCLASIFWRSVAAALDDSLTLEGICAPAGKFVKKIPWQKTLSALSLQ